MHANIRVKFILVPIFVIMSMMLLVYANGTHNGDLEEDTSIRHQFEELNPLHHFAENHVFAGIVLIVLWFSLFYLIYTLIQLLMNKRH